MYITFKKTSGSKLIVEYSEQRPNAAILLPHPKWHVVGKALVAFANNKKAISKIIPKELLEYNGDDIDILFDELRADLLSICGKGVIPAKEGESVSDRLRYSLLLQDSTDFFKPSVPLSFSVFFDFGSKEQNLYDIWQVYKVETLQEVIALEFIKYAEGLVNRSAKPIKECKHCGKFYIAEKYSASSYCSDACRSKNFSETTASDPYFKKYRSMQIDIRRNIDPISEEAEQLYQKWKAFAEAEWRKGSTTYISPTEYRKTMRKYWNDLKGGKNCGKRKG